MNLATATPRDIDAKLAALYIEVSKAQDHHASIQASLRNAQINKAKGWPCYTPYTEQDADAAYKKAQALIEQALPYEAEYQRRPWQRYWHVTNGNGHIHTSQACSSCFPDTRFAWRTDLSGLTDVEVVEREAYNACTVCMPIAPAEQKAARERYNREQREAKAAERQAKKDTKDAKSRERAVKLVDKVEAAIEKLGGRQVFDTEYSLYGHDGRKSIYDWAFDNCQSTVGDVLYDLKDGEQYRHINQFVKDELRKRGLV
jgi:hypothetical protein